MKQTGVFVGAFLLATGAIFLLRNVGLVQIDIGTAGRYWAIILIMLGASFLLQNLLVKSLLTGGAAIFLAAIIWSSILNFQPFEILEEKFDKASAGSPPKTFAIPFDGAAQRAKLNIHAMMGAFAIEDATADLAIVETNSPLGYVLERERFADYDLLTLKPERQKAKRVISRGGGSTTLKLNAAPTWELDLNIAAASADLDLSKFKVEKLNIDAGASSIDLRLGNLADKLDVTVDAGAASLNIEIPKDVGCEIRHSDGLGSAEFEGFVLKDKASRAEQSDSSEKKIFFKGWLRGNAYRTENFDRSAKKIYINLDSGVSSVNVRRY